MSTIKSFFARLRKKKPKVSNVVEAEKKKSNVTVESFVMKYEDIFNGLLTGKNVIVYSDSDTDVEVDRPPPPPIQVRMTQKYEKLDKQKQKKQAAIDKINKRKANARKRSLMLLEKRRARMALKGKEMEKPAMSNGGTKKIEKETVSKEEKVKVVAETIPKLEIKEVAKQTGKDKKNMRWRNLLTKTTAFRILQGKKDKTVMGKKAYKTKENRDVIVDDNTKDGNIDKNIGLGKTDINDLNSKEKKEELRLAKGSTTIDVIHEKKSEDEKIVEHPPVKMRKLNSANDGSSLSSAISKPSLIDELDGMFFGNKDSKDEEARLRMHATRQAKKTCQESEKCDRGNRFFK